MKDSKPLLLLLLSAGLIITWGYHLYDKSRYVNQTKEIFVKDTSAVAKAVADSLREFFTHTLNELDTANIQTDSINNLAEVDLQNKITGINQLRQDIREILKRKELKQADITAVKIKIDDLKIRLADLKKEDTTATNEKLNGIVAELNKEVKSRQQNIQKTGVANSQPGKIEETPVFIVSDIRFAAYSAQAGQKEIETTEQERANKFIASFTVRNNTAGFQNAEIIAVIADPTGKSVNPELWDAGSFETKNEGRKIYTRKIKFEYNKGETKRLLFSLEPDTFEKGTYKLTLYHNGVRIGQSTWKLS